MDILHMLSLGQNPATQAGQRLRVTPNQMQSALEAVVPLKISRTDANTQDLAHVDPRKRWTRA